MSGTLNAKKAIRCSAARSRMAFFWNGSSSRFDVLFEIPGQLGSRLIADHARQFLARMIKNEQGRIVLYTELPNQGAFQITIELQADKAIG